MAVVIKTHKEYLKPFINPATAWALSIGASVGWGSLVVTTNSFLKGAGPVGSILGLVIGAVIMLIISRNYSYLMDCYPDAGGAYTYAKQAFGYDHGFLTAWFLALVYFSILWANITAVPEFIRFLAGNVFRFGFHYTLFGSEVWLGEILITVAVILLVGVLCAGFGRIATMVITAMSLAFVIGIVICFIAALLKHGNTGFSYQPLYLPDKSVVTQAVRVACISPWAFIGFECISHASEEFSFPVKKARRIMFASVIASALVYIFVFVLSVTAYPPEYDSWLAYIADLGNLSGLKGLPAFYAAQYYLGRDGVFILTLVMFCVVVTSLFCTTLALSRLLYSTAKDNILPVRFASLSEQHLPKNAVFLIAGITLIVPFLGRTAIGWIVEVTTVCATIIYGLVSACAFKIAYTRKDKVEKTTGIAGFVLMIFLAVLLLLPDLFGINTIANESYFLFAVWVILGFLFFHFVLRRDKGRLFGHSVIVWVALTFLIMFISLVWLSRTSMVTMTNAVGKVKEFYDETKQQGMPEEEVFLSEEIDALQRENKGNTGVAVGFFCLSMVILLVYFAWMRRRMESSEMELALALEKANQDPLTGVKSKHSYVEHEERINQGIREGTVGPFAIAVCDVNGLKRVNDTRGHMAGDELIRTASKLICEIFQHSLIFRFGGDEFVVIMTGRDYENRAKLVSDLNKRVEPNIGTEELVIAVGMAEYFPEEDHECQDVFEKADHLMNLRSQDLKFLDAKVR